MSSSVRDTLTRVASFSAVTPISKASASAAFRFIGGFRAGERETGILLVTVEEMLAVEHHLAAGGLGCCDAVADRGEVLLLRRLERNAHLIGRRLRHEADRVGFGFQQPGHTGIV